MSRCSYEFVGFKKYYFERDLGTEDKKKICLLDHSASC